MKEPMYYVRLKDSFLSPTSSRFSRQPTTTPPSNSGSFHLAAKSDAFLKQEATVNCWLRDIELLDANGKEAMPVPEQRVLEHNRKQDNGESSAPPIGVDLPPAIRAELLNPALWQDGLAKYARATHLAVALADTAGRQIGETINPRPTWSLLHAKPPTGIRSQESGVRDQESADRSDVPHLSPDSCLLTPGGCPFSLAPLKSCHCAADALAR